MGRNLRQFPKVLEGVPAKEMLAKLTNETLAPLKQTGTRITIVEPLDELVVALRRGDFREFIEETWWEVLVKPEAEIRVSVDGKTVRAQCPEIFRNLASGGLPANVIYRVENQPVEIRDQVYRVKRLSMAKSEKPIPLDLQGLAIQRKGMKIGVLELKDMPAELEELFWGFVELDKDYEAQIEEAEDLEHYSFRGTYASYRNLKKFAQSAFDEFKRQLGYDVDSQRTADQKAKEALRQAQQKLNDIMENLGLTGIGEKRTVKREITASVFNVEFPHSTNEVFLDDNISNISFQLKNKSPYMRDLKVVIETRGSNGALIESIQTQTFKLPVTLAMASN